MIVENVVDIIFTMSLTMTVKKIVLVYGVDLQSLMNVGLVMWMETIIVLKIVKELGVEMQ